MVDAEQSLKRFRDAVTDGDQTRAVEVGSETAAALTQVSDREAGVDAAARIVLSEPSAGDASQEAAEAVVKRVQEYRNRRTEYGMLLKGLATGNFDQEEALSVTNSVLDAQAAAESAVVEFRQTTAFERLDPILAGITPDAADLIFPKGGDSPQPNPPQGKSDSGGGGNDQQETTETVTFTLTNLGGTAANTIDADVTTDLPDPTVNPTAVSELPSLSEEAVSITFETGVPGGRYGTQVSFGSEEGAAETVTLPIVIVDKLGYIDEAIQLLEAFRSTISEFEGKTTGPVRPILQTVDTAIEDLEALRSRLKKGNIN